MCCIISCDAHQGPEPMPGGGGQRYPGCLAISDLGMVRAEPEPGLCQEHWKWKLMQARLRLDSAQIPLSLTWSGHGSACWSIIRPLCIANHLTLAYLFPPTERTPVSAPLALCVHTHVAILSQVFSSRVLYLIF